MKKTWLMLMVATLIFQGAALAKEISGTVSAVNAADSKLTISESDAAGVAQDVEVVVSPEVVYTGVTKLDELTVGTQVQLEVEQNAAGAWEAKAISAKSEEAPAEVPAEAPAAEAQQ